MSRQDVFNGYVIVGRKYGLFTRKDLLDDTF